MPAAVSARWPRQEIPRIRFEPPALAGHENVAPVENLKIWAPPPTRFSAAISAFGATSISAIGHPQLAPGAKVIAGVQQAARRELHHTDVMDSLPLAERKHGAIRLNTAGQQI